MPTSVQCLSSLFLNALVGGVSSTYCAKAIGVQANFFFGAEPSLLVKYLDSAQKTAMLTCKIALPDSFKR